MMRYVWIVACVFALSCKTQQKATYAAADIKQLTKYNQLEDSLLRIAVSKELPDEILAPGFRTWCATNEYYAPGVNVMHGGAYTFFIRSEDSLILALKNKRYKKVDSIYFITYDTIKYVLNNTIFGVKKRINIQAYYLDLSYFHNDSMDLHAIDSLIFRYHDIRCKITKYCGKSDYGDKSVTLFISDKLGIFKEYSDEYTYATGYQVRSMRDSSNLSLNLDPLIQAHIYALYQNPSFHQRCDNGPTWIHHLSYLTSDTPNCNKYEWPNDSIPEIFYEK